MEEKSPTEKAIFSVKDLIYILTLALGFGIQYFTIKVQIHDAISEIDFNKKEQNFLIGGLTNSVAEHEKRLDGLSNAFNQLAIKPKEIRIESE